MHKRIIDVVNMRTDAFDITGAWDTRKTGFFTTMDNRVKLKRSFSVVQIFKPGF